MQPCPDPACGGAGGDCRVCGGAGHVPIAKASERLNTDTELQAILAEWSDLLTARAAILRYKGQALRMLGARSSDTWHPEFLEALEVFEAEYAEREYEQRVADAKKSRDESARRRSR